ncbi:MAG: DUF2252 family protein [Mycobacteriales bacterium]
MRARGPGLLRLKVARMAASPFAFFRGTFHLLTRDALAYADLAARDYQMFVGRRAGIEDTARWAGE